MSVSLDREPGLATQKIYHNTEAWVRDIKQRRDTSEILMLLGTDQHLEMVLLHRDTGQIERLTLEVHNEPMLLPSGFGIGEVLAAEGRLRRQASEGAWAHPPYAGKVVRGKGIFTYPLGPVRADVAEALSYQLQVMGDEIVRLDLVPQLKERQVSHLAVGKSLNDALRIVERTTGTSTVAHALAYSLAVEDALDWTVDPTVAQCRMIAAELERVYSHLGDLATLAVSTGMPIPQMEYLHHKESILRLNQRVFGHRYMRGLVAPGGTTQDTTPREWQSVGAVIVAIRDAVEQIQEDLGKTTSYLDRLHGAGVIPSETVDFVRPVGPVGRAANRPYDVRRMRPYLNYHDAHFEMPVLASGDSYARFMVKARELIQSLAMLRRWMASDAWLPVTGQAPRPPQAPREDTVGVGVVEAPRGLLSYRVCVGPDLTIRQLDAGTPSERNWYVVPAAIANKNILQDFPIIDASFGLSVAGWDK